MIISLFIIPSDEMEKSGLYPNLLRRNAAKVESMHEEWR